MALDSKRKRGSAMLMGLPFRQWLAEPDGTLAATDRVSLLKLCSAITPGGAPTFKKFLANYSNIVILPPLR